MFNLGTKTVVLNSNANVTEANGVISIAGFGTLQSQQLLAGRQGEFLQKCSGRCVHNHLVTPYDDTKTYDIVLGIRSERVLSNIFSDIDVWTSNLKQVVLTLVGRLLQLKLQDLTIR
jgi:hypothetical protein